MRRNPNDLLGQVLWGANNIFWVACEDGRERRCRLRGKILGQKGLEHNPLSCGDWVLLDACSKSPANSQGEEDAQIYCRIERRNALQRRNLKRGEPQTFAANIDGVILLLSWAAPKLRSGFLDRLWIAAQRSEAHTLVLLNKIDCINSLGELCQMHRILRRYRRLGLKIQPVCLKPEQHFREYRFEISQKYQKKSMDPASRQKKMPGLPNLLRLLELYCTRLLLRCIYLPIGRIRLKRLYVLLAGRLYALIGASGAGKSSLCNYLFHSQIQQVQAVSEKWQRGVHTTTLAKIIEYRNGKRRYRLIDTPGLRNFLPDFRENELANLQDFYPEFARLRSLCNYAACEHRSEPGCAVRDALALGLIAEPRYRSYCNLYNDLKESFAQKPEYRANAGCAKPGAQPGKTKRKINGKPDTRQKSRRGALIQNRRKIRADAEESEDSLF